MLWTILMSNYAKMTNLWQLADSHRFDLKGQSGITSNIYSSLIYSYIANEKKDHFILFTHEGIIMHKTK